MDQVWGLDKSPTPFWDSVSSSVKWREITDPGKGDLGILAQLLAPRLDKLWGARPAPSGIRLGSAEWDASLALPTSGTACVVCMSYFCKQRKEIYKLSF